jgi:hypothetical protein
MESAEESPKPTRPPRPPRGLLVEGRMLWWAVVGTEEPLYVLRPDELALLERACMTVDDLVDLNRVLSAAGSLTV